MGLYQKSYQHTSRSVYTFRFLKLNLIYYYYYFYPALIMGKEIVHIDKHSQSQISTLSTKKPVFHLQLIKNHPKSIPQELVSLILSTKSKLIPFCVTKIPYRII